MPNGKRLFRSAPIQTSVYPHRLFRVCLLMALAVLSCVWQGCGKKGPPRPPKRPLPPVVQDLRHTLKNDVVELSWTLPSTAGGNIAKPATIKVLRASQTGQEIGCEECPLRFEIVAEIPVHAKASDKSGPRRLQYSEIIDSGYRYIYKVILFDEYGYSGKASNSVKFDH